MAVKTNHQLGHPILITFGTELDANRNPVPGERHFLDDNISNGYVVRIAQSDGHGVDRDAACAQVMEHGFGSAGRAAVDAVTQEHHSGEGDAPVGIGDHFE